MNCGACNENCKESSYRLYNDAIVSIRESKRFIDLPQSVVDNVIKMIYPEKIMIIWQSKSRCRCNLCCIRPPDNDISDSDSNSDSDSGGYSSIDDDEDDYCSNSGYIYNTHCSHLCCKCFLEGIEKIDNSYGTLPYLRFHANIFFNKIPVSIDPYKYILPCEYNITFYRRKTPVKRENKLYITIN